MLQILQRVHDNSDDSALDVLPEQTAKGTSASDDEEGECDNQAGLSEETVTRLVARVGHVFAIFAFTEQK